ncbi:MAG: aminotransferase class IV [Planctomycetes bacterium]|nr:aminotransferase class IV [Planctomycetota bacterium]
MKLLKCQNPPWQSLLVQYGLGAFETMLAVDGEIPLLNAHKKRLANALKAWGQKSECEEINELWLEVKELAKNANSYAKVKLLLGINQGDELIYQITISEQQKPGTYSPVKLQTQKTWGNLSSAYKSCNYGQHYLARQKALASGCDDVLYVNEEGDFLECGIFCLALLSPEQGLISKGPRLQSVSADYFLRAQPDFWQESTIHLKNITDAAGQIICMNAVQGLRQVCHIQNEQGEIIYTAAPCSNDILEPFNQSLFASQDEEENEL